MTTGRSRPESERPMRVLAVITETEQRQFFPPALWQELQALSSTLDVVCLEPSDQSGLAEALERTQADVLIACWKTPQLPAALPPRLRYVCYLAGSVKKVVTRRHLESGLFVTDWGGSISRVVAEWALFHILASLRRAAYWAIAMHTKGAWKNDHTETASLFGRTIGIHGFGRIARELRELLRPFDVSVRVFAPDVSPEIEQRFEVRKVDALETLFAENDIVVELAPLVPSTAGCVQEKHLRLLRRGAVFVLIGRGAVVDEAALVQVAREGHVQFGIDVFEQEPLPPDHPLRGLTNVMLTPHLGGPTSDRRRDAGAFALHNLRAYAEGRPLEAVITTAAYDAST